MRALFICLISICTLPQMSYAITAQELSCITLGSDYKIERSLVAKGCSLTSRDAQLRLVKCEVENFGSVNINVTPTDDDLFRVSLLFVASDSELSLSSLSQCDSADVTYDVVTETMITSLKYGRDIVSARILRLPIETSNSAAEGLNVWYLVRGSGSTKYMNRFLRYFFTRNDRERPDWLTANSVAQLDPKVGYDRRDEVQIFGEPLVFASQVRMNSAITNRRWTVEDDYCAYWASASNCVSKNVTYTNTLGELGIEKIETTYSVGLTESVDYIFKNQKSYLDFVQALDRRYGTSTRETSGGCTTRNWEVGDVDITGYFCSREDQKWRLSFMNFEVYDKLMLLKAASKFALSDLLQPNSTRRNQNPEIPHDMY
jgi:hypothetical protein